LFPTSYKRPYRFEETENANVLERAEVLNQITQLQVGQRGRLIVTYPEALTEKVVNKRTLLANTFTIKQGEEVEMSFVTDILHEYEFERVETVYEAGQYSVRGGILDVFSFSNDLPYRLEFFGDEVESIRTFNPDSQLSITRVEQIAVIPNVQSKLGEEIRESFLKFLPAQTPLWFKNLNETLDVIEKYFDKATIEFEQIIAKANFTQVISGPEELFETVESFRDDLSRYTKLEFGSIFQKKEKATQTFTWDAENQPSFSKKFSLLGEHLQENEINGIDNFICAEAPNQLDRIETILVETTGQARFTGLPIALRAGFYDKQQRITCYTDHQIFERFHRAKLKERHKQSKSLTLKELNTLQVGDYVTHIDYGVGRFAGLKKIDINGREQEAIRLIYRDNDMLLVSLHALHKIAKYGSKDGHEPKLHKLGSPEWEKSKKKVKKKLKDIGKELISLYAKRRQEKGFAYSPDSYMQMELETSFVYEDTPDQAKTTAEVKADMEKPYPMDRLVCGDVGFGKTEIAIRSAFKAVADNKQVAVLVPTTILASQHHRTFAQRLKNFPCKVEFVNRFKSAKEVREIQEELKKGHIDILIGTHKIVGKQFKFKDLGLMIIDEEQKFGVKVKNQLKQMRINVDALTLTATPIPRTLHFSLMGARDLSVINTPPPNRQPVKTEVQPFNEAIIRDAVSYEIRRGGQVFFVHNRISDIEEIANIIMRLVPDSRVTYAHGQMKADTLEKTMMSFIDHEYDVLVSTNIIESGLDIPNANTIIINRAHMFGLSDLHQMRGRVGRSNKKAYCYLLAPALVGLTSDARKRLRALEEFSDLGSGFKIAMRDLDIRGAGNLLGAEQSGFINDLGFDTYHKMLDEAMSDLRENEFKALFEGENPDPQNFKVECVIETDHEIQFPESYISSVTERLQLYIEADNLKNKYELEKFQDRLRDRFGKYPPEAENLFLTVELRWLAEKIGFEKLVLKKEKIRGYFIADKPDYYKTPIFGEVVQYVSARPKRCRLKETSDRLIFIMDNVRTLEGAHKVLQSIVRGE
ncbi:MAG: transcription-repair coupling factor, partial [Bacteroidota bacterium]